MPKARPVSLFPLSFDEALKGLLNVDPAKVGLGKKKKAKRKAKRKQDKS